MTVEVRLIQPDEIDTWIRSVSMPFLEMASEDAYRHWRPHVEPNRTWAAVDGDRFVGTCCVFTRDVTLPGTGDEPSPVASMTAVSGVGVQATHRRRGLLRRMIGAMLADGIERGEPIAGLLASESAIYGQFGFGWATSFLELALQRRTARIVNPAPDLDLVLCNA
ncbi:MAG: GNAT family N-acetyltransferase, partial [Acidimicrobiales bacterium]